MYRQPSTSIGGPVESFDGIPLIPNNEADDDDDEFNAASGHSLFTTGGLTPDRDGTSIPPISTPFKKKQMSFGTVDSKRMPSHWDPSFSFIGLPYSFARKNMKDRHYMGVVFRVNSIIAHELGYPSWLEYILTRGWHCTYNREKDTYEIKFRRVEEVLSVLGVKGWRLLHRNLHALLVSLYSRLQDPNMKNVYGGTLPLKFMEESSFIAKINTLAQDLLKALVITVNCFLPFVKERKTDKRYWTEEIFKGCFSRPKLKLFMADLVILFNGAQNGQVGDGSLQRDLIYNHRDALVTEVGRRCASIRFDADMRSFIHDQLKATVGPHHLRFQKTFKNSEKNWAVVKNRIMDTAIPLLEKQFPERGCIPSITYKQKNLCDTSKLSMRSKKQKGEPLFDLFLVIEFILSIVNKHMQYTFVSYFRFAC